MDALTQKRALRFRFLQALYERVDGSPSASVNMHTFGEELGFTSAQTHAVVEYLANEHLLEYVALGGEIGITHYGVVQVESALKTPEQETQYFPPVVNVLNVQTMIGSQVQQAGSGSTQAASMGASDLEGLRAFLDALSGARQNLQLEPATAAELEAEAATLRAQLQSPKPKRTVVMEALKSLRAILEGAAGSLAASLLLQKLMPLLGGG